MKKIVTLFVFALIPVVFTLAFTTIGSHRTPLSRPSSVTSRGTACTYAVTFNQSVQYDLRSIPGLSVSAQSHGTIRTRLTGTLSMTPIPVTDTAEAGKKIFALELSPERVRVECDGEPQAAEVTREALKQPCFVQVGPEGQILSIRIATQDEVAYNMLRSLLAQMEGIYTPWDKVGKSGLVTGTDEHGTFQANREIIPISNNSWKICRRKIRYTAVSADSTAPHQQGAAVEANTWEAIRDKNDLLSLKANVRTGLLLDGKKFGTADLRVGLDKRGTYDVSEQRDRLASLYPNLSPRSLFMSAPLDEKAAEQRRYKTRLTPEDTPDRLAARMEKLRDLPLSQNRMEQASRLERKVEAILAVEPERLPEFRALLTGLPITGEAFPRLIQCMAQGSDDSQALAAEMLLQRCESETQMLLNLIPSFALAPKPDMATVALLRRLSFHRDPVVAGAAQLGLGSVARTLVTNPSLASALVSELSARLSQADPAEQQNLLLALGNAGHPDSLPVVHVYTKDRDAETRAAAFRSLRFLPQPEATSLLLTGLDDRESVVRRETSEALGYRVMSATMLQKMARIVRREPNASVRQNLYRTFWQSRKIEHALVKSVLQLGRKDADPEVRKMVQALYSGM